MASAGRSRHRLRWSRPETDDPAAAGATVLSLFLLDRALPPPLPGASGFSTVVVAADGTPLRAFADAAGVWRHPVTFDAVSAEYVAALVGYEDRWFWHHPGVNPLALLRAAAQRLGRGREISGGSTLTMRGARILGPQPRGVAGKLRQMLRALQLGCGCRSARSSAISITRPSAAPCTGRGAAGPISASPRPGCRARRRHCCGPAAGAEPVRPDRHPAAAQQARDKVVRRPRAAYGRSRRWPRRARTGGRAPAGAATPRPAAGGAAAPAQPGAARVPSTIDASLQADPRNGCPPFRATAGTHQALLVVDNATLKPVPTSAPD